MNCNVSVYVSGINIDIDIWPGDHNGEYSQMRKKIYLNTFSIFKILHA